MAKKESCYLRRMGIMMNGYVVVVESRPCACRIDIESECVDVSQAPAQPRRKICKDARTSVSSHLFSISLQPQVLIRPLNLSGIMF
jgi:hypothetical protein